jgi:hypothetical protein
MRFRTVLLWSMLLPWLSPLLPGSAAAAAEPGQLVLPDFSALAKKASRSVDISLDPSLLGLAGGILSADPDPDAAAVKSLIAGLKGIYVRSYDFDQEGAYSKAEVDRVRAQLVAPAWVPLVSTHDRQRRTDVDVYARRSGARTDGVAIITAAPRQLTIVNIVGAIDLARLAQLQGRLGIPRLDLLPQEAAPPPPPPGPPASGPPRPAAAQPPH